MFNMKSPTVILIFVSLVLFFKSATSCNVYQTTQAPNGTFSAFELESLNAHNVYRKKHGVPLLKLSRSLCNVAQTWANKLGETDVFKHSGVNYGENLYASTVAAGNGKASVDAWYNEIQSYNYSDPVFSSKTGHFTQVVWKNSLELGVAQAKGKSKTYVVANYNPPGNYKGQFKDNVLPAMA